MKKAALFVLLFFAVLATAAPTPDEYPIKVHVISSNWTVGPTAIGLELYQRLNVVIDGNKYDLEAIDKGANARNVAVLAPGDYKAKLVQDEHKNAYEFSQTYEFLFPDKKTKKFIVMGQSE